MKPGATLQSTNTPLCFINQLTESFSSTFHFLPLRQRQAQMVIYNATSNKIDYDSQVYNFLNPEILKNRNIGSKVEAVLLDRADIL